MVHVSLVVRKQLIKFTMIFKKQGKRFGQFLIVRAVCAGEIVVYISNEFPCLKLKCVPCQYDYHLWVYPIVG